MFKRLKITQKLLFVLCLSASIVAHSQTAEQVVNNYIQFLGGVANWKAVKSITTAGTYNYGGMEFPYTAVSKAPNLYKYVVTANGKSFTQAYDGKTGWRIDGFKNETTKTILKNKEAKAMANEADVELETAFINYPSKGHKVILEGKDTINSQLCYRIKFIHKDGDTARYFFDSKNYSLVKKQAVSKNTEMKNAMMDIFYSEYKEINKIKLAHKISCSVDGQKILTITTKSVKLNEPVSDADFKP